MQTFNNKIALNIDRDWVSLEEALKMAPAQQKPIHAISISGPLFDESC